MTVEQAEQAYRAAERAFVADPTDETMAATTEAEIAWLDAGELAAGGTLGGFRLEWSI